jgi:hypothetical protein
MQHAMTSFVIPDPLTGRTGTEEALITLTSGVAHPWKPLAVGQFRILKSLTALTPRRDYYPDQTLRLLKTEAWPGDFTTTQCHEDFMRVIDGILAMSERLRQFNPTAQANTSGTTGDSPDGE